MVWLPYGSEGHWAFMELPVVRLTYAGVPMLGFFFIIGGYTNAISHLRLMRATDAVSRSKLLRNLSSSAFRRWFRLYLPVFSMMLLVSLLARTGLFAYTKPFVARGSQNLMLHGFPERHLETFNTVWEQLSWLVLDASGMANLFDFKRYYPAHDPHLWTIKEEFRAALSLFILLLATASMKVSVRIVIFGLVALWQTWNKVWPIALFTCGALVAECHISFQEMTSPLRTDEERAIKAGEQYTTPIMKLCSWTQKYCGHWLSFSLFLVSLWLLSTPNQGYTTASGYQILASTIPDWAPFKEMWLTNIGALLFISVMLGQAKDSLYHQAFTNVYAQYLGELSFAIYIIHGPMLHAFGYMLPLWFWQVFGDDGLIKFTLGLSLVWIINLLILLTCADLFQRHIEHRCGNFTHRLESRWSAA